MRYFQSLKGEIFSSFFEFGFTNLRSNGTKPYNGYVTSSPDQGLESLGKEF
eukprot:UN28086